MVRCGSTHTTVALAITTPLEDLVETARWAHASLAIVVPVVRTGAHVLPTGMSGWQLKGLFSRGDALSTPSEVAWDPIADERIRWALEPVLDDRCVATRPPKATTATGAATATTGTGASDEGDDLAGEEVAGADAFVSVMPPLEKLVAAAGWLPAGTSDAPGSSGKEAPAPLPSGCAIRAVEVLHFPTYDRRTGTESGLVRTGAGDLDSFVVAHVVLSGEALVDPGAAAAYFALPATKTDLRVGYNSSDPAGSGSPLRVMSFTQWADLLGVLGFARIGPTGTVVPRRKDVFEVRAWRPFVISHLVPNEAVPASPFAAADDLAHWDDVQAWGWRMTGGQWLTQAWEPGRGIDDPTRDGVWVGSTWVRATDGGLAFIGTRGPGERGTVHDREGATWWRLGEFHNVEHVRVAGIAHRNAVRLAALSIRQSEKLQERAEQLVGTIRWPQVPTAHTPEEGDGGAGGGEEVSAAQREFEELVKIAAHEVTQMEMKLVQTRNQLWFSQLPGRREEGAVLRVLQSAAGTPDLLGDIEVEQTQVARTLQQQEALVAAARARREEGARVRAAELMAQRLRVEDLERAEGREAAAEAARQAEAAAREAQASRQQRLDDDEKVRLAQANRDKKLHDVLSGLSAFIGLFFIVDLALAVTQVRQGGGWGDVRGALSFAAPAVVLFGAGLVWAYLHPRGNADNRKGKATGAGSGSGGPDGSGGAGA